MEQYYTDIDEIRKNSFLYIEYGALEHSKRIIFFTLILFIFMFVSILIPCDIYQIITGDSISHDSIFSLFAKDNPRKMSITFNPFIAAFGVIVFILATPMLIRTIFLVGDIYFCNNFVYIKRILLPNKIKKFSYKYIVVRYNSVGSDRFLLVNKAYKSLVLEKDGPNEIIFMPEYKKLHSYGKFIFFMKRTLMGWFWFRIMRATDKKDKYHVVPNHYDMDDIAELLKKHGVAVVDCTFK